MVSDCMALDTISLSGNKKREQLPSFFIFILSGKI